MVVSKYIPIYKQFKKPKGNKILTDRILAETGKLNL